MDSEPQFPVSDQASSAGLHTVLRRTLKACASCRRDKTKCDGARPCNGCSKKGLSADQCVDGCEPCRRVRARCDGGKPCLRCTEQQIECVDGAVTQMSLNPQHSVLPPPPKTIMHRVNPTRSTERAKLACQSCRRDNKKCEDLRPCSRCVSRGEECIHVGRGPKQVKLRCEACRKGNKRCEDARPCSFCLQQDIECVNLARKGRGHGTRVKAACTNCRRDKIRCDGSRPCASCQRKGVACTDRACQACAEKGMETQCTHRRAPELVPPPHIIMEEPKAEAQPSASAIPPHMIPPPHLIPFPAGYTFSYYTHHPPFGIPQGTLPPPFGLPGPGSDQPMLPFPPPGPGGYYPVIDPSIDGAPTEVPPPDVLGPTDDVKGSDVIAPT